MYKIIVDQNIWIKGSVYHLNELVDVEGILAEQLERAGKIAKVEKEAPPAPAQAVDAEPALDAPKKQGKAIRPSKRK